MWGYRGVRQVGDEKQISVQGCRLTTASPHSPNPNLYAAGDAGRGQFINGAGFLRLLAEAVAIAFCCKATGSLLLVVCGMRAARGEGLQAAPGSWRPGPAAEDGSRVRSWGLGAKMGEAGVGLCLRAARQQGYDVHGTGLECCMLASDDAGVSAGYSGLPPVIYVDFRGPPQQPEDLLGCFFDSQQRRFNSTQEYSGPDDVTMAFFNTCPELCQVRSKNYGFDVRGCLASQVRIPAG